MRVKGQRTRIGWLVMWKKRGGGGGGGERCQYILLRREVKFGADGPMVTGTICSSEVSNPTNLM